MMTPMTNHEGAGEVEAGGWFVEEERDGVMDDVGANGDAVAFAARDVAVVLVADDQRREKLVGERKKIWCKQFHHILIDLNRLIF